MINKHQDNVVDTHDAQSIGDEQPEGGGSRLLREISSGETLPIRDVVAAEFRNGDIAYVEWSNEQTLILAPWDEDSSDGDQSTGDGCSIGFFSNSPHLGGIMLIPHRPFDLEGKQEFGAIVIPYDSIELISRIGPFPRGSDEGEMKDVE